MRDEAINAVLMKVGLAVASATILGGGSMVLTAHTDNARQEIRLERLEKATEKIETLSEKLDQTNQNIAVLNARMEAARDERPRNE